MKDIPLRRAWLFPILLLLIPLPAHSYQPLSVAQRQSLRKNAWDILWAGAHDTDAQKRSRAVAALGLVQPSPEVVRLVEGKLRDQEPEVREAAATALGEMSATSSVPRLKQMLSDEDISVALAAARSLLLMKKSAGYDIYYSILTGKRKTGQTLIERQLHELNDPKKLAVFAFDQGIGFLPYAGYGMEFLQELGKKNSAPLRAAAAGILGKDPDPRSARALAAACSDSDWMVRAAALKAVALRGDPALLADVTPALRDTQDMVRFTAAAAVLRLTRTA